ncbi:MAG TPA: hypothetical protein VF521_01885, partial [Pyrinomonadaceae bacterium]
MEEKRNRQDDDAHAPDLAQRLARRQSEHPGVVDVSAPLRHYERTAGWVAQKFSLVNRVRERYGAADARTAAQASFVMRRPSPDADDVGDNAAASTFDATPSSAALQRVSSSVASSPSTTPEAAASAAPQRFAAPSAEQAAARAVMLPSRTGSGSTQMSGEDSSSTV